MAAGWSATCCSAGMKNISCGGAKPIIEACVYVPKGLQIMGKVTELVNKILWQDLASSLGCPDTMHVAAFRVAH